MNLGVLAAISAPTAGLVIALIALYRSRAQQRVDRAQQKHLEDEHTKRVANRRIMLERWADDVQRYHYQLRTYLIDLADQGIIDASRTDLSKFPPPPMPTMNGDDG